MNEPQIRNAAVIQMIIFIGFHVILYLDDTKLTNLLYLGNISQYIENLFPATLWNVTFGELFPGQVWVFLLLPVVGVIFLFRARDRSRRKSSLALFHISFVIWTIFPLLATKLGDYSGP